MPVVHIETLKKLSIWRSARSHLPLLGPRARNPPHLNLSTMVRQLHQLPRPLQITLMTFQSKQGIRLTWEPLRNSSARSSGWTGSTHFLWFLDDKIQMFWPIFASFDTDLTMWNFITEFHLNFQGCCENARGWGPTSWAFPSPDSGSTNLICQAFPQKRFRSGTIRWGQRVPRGSS